MTGCCQRCGAVGVVEADHWTGRIRGRPVHRTLCWELCVACHGVQGRRDRALGLEPTSMCRAVWLRRIAGRLGDVASRHTTAVTLESGLVVVLANTLAAIADDYPQSR